MQLHRILAMFKRYALVYHRDLNKIFEVSVWPLFDLLTWGFISLWIARDANLGNEAYFPIYSMFFWQNVSVANLGVATSVLDEILGKNVSGIASSPLTVPEWIVSLMVLSTVRVLLIAVVFALILKSLFGISVLVFGWWLLPLLVLALLGGCTLGLLSACLVIRWGNRASAFIWATWHFATLCGVFVPFSELPDWMQALGEWVPLTYFFKLIQTFLTTGTIPIHDFAVTALSILVFLVIIAGLFIVAYTATKKQGVSHVEAQ